jgi:translation elongation factor EF-1beta
MRVSVIQFKSRLGDVDTNIEKTVAFVKDAIKEGAELCLFPELSLTGYNLQDLTFEVALKRDDKRLIPLLELSRKAGIIVGLIEEDENHVFYNSAFYLKDGEINVEKLKREITRIIKSEPQFKIDYVSVASGDTLEEFEGELSGDILVSVAVFLGKTRLIDNFTYSVSDLYNC